MKRCEAAVNPWKRSAEFFEYQMSAGDEYYFDHLAKKRPKYEKYSDNRYMDIESKRAALKASPSIVAVVSYSGEKELSQGCGTIIEAADQEDNVFIVITSASLIRRPAEEEYPEFAVNTLADNLKVVVHASDNTPYKGEICAFDFHYNILTIKFKSDTPLPVAKIRAIDDRLSLNSVEEKPFELRPHSVKLEAGDPVIAVGRYFTKPFKIMAAPGCFSIDRCDHECKELFLAFCTTTRCGDGSALINLSGEVIGITFYNYSSSTPFLPINIARKWWEHYKMYRESRRPHLGFEATSLFAADLDLLEMVFRRFPSISKGVLVELVIPGSSAHSAGLQQDDVIVKCDGNTVESFLELFDMMWDKVGGSVELVVVRADRSTFLTLNMVVVEVTSDKFYRWRQWP